MKGGRARAALTTATAVWMWLSSAGTAHAEWLLSGYLGAVKTGSAPLHITQPTLGTDVTLASVEYHGESFTSPQYYGYRLTWFSRKRSWLGVEAEFVHPKAFADTGRVTRASGQVGGMRIEQPVPVGSVIERFSISHGLNMVLFNAVARHAFGSQGTRARVVVAGRFGAGPTIPHAESTIEGRQSAEGYAWGAPVWQAAAGVQVRLVTRLDAVGEYKFTRTRQSVDVDRGKADGVFASHHIVFGLSWHLTRDR